MSERIPQAGDVIRLPQSVAPCARYMLRKNGSLFDLIDYSGAHKGSRLNMDLRVMLRAGKAVFDDTDADSFRASVAKATEVQS